MRLLLVLTLLGTGCTSARSGYVMINAARSLEKARDAGAEKKAPYEFTLAVAYFDKAREENGANEFGHADLLAQTSMDWAARALENTSDAEREFGEVFVPEERVEEKKEQKENSLDKIDLDDL
jgi:hypothetical protein